MKRKLIIATLLVACLTSSSAYAVTKYTVKFVDKNGEVLSEQSVEEGDDAEAPEVEDSNFRGWSIGYDDVEEDLTVYAVYNENIGSVGNASDAIADVTGNAGSAGTVVDNTNSSSDEVISAKGTSSAPKATASGEESKKYLNSSSNIGSNQTVSKVGNDNNKSNVTASKSNVSTSTKSNSYVSKSNTTKSNSSKDTFKTDSRELKSNSNDSSNNSSTKKSTYKKVSATSLKSMDNLSTGQPLEGEVNSSARVLVNGTKTGTNNSKSDTADDMYNNNHVVSFTEVSISDNNEDKDNESSDGNKGKLITADEELEIDDMESRMLEKRNKNKLIFMMMAFGLGGLIIFTLLIFLIRLIFKKKKVEEDDEVEEEVEEEDVDDNAEDDEEKEVEDNEQED